MKKIMNYLPFFVLFLLPILFYPGVDTSGWRSSGDVNASLEFASSLLAITAGITGIKGADILIEAKILAVAHALEELTSRRAYRDAFPLKQALNEIKGHRGSQYDPDVVNACLMLFNEKGYKTEG